MSGAVSGAMRELSFDVTVIGAGAAGMAAAIAVTKRGFSCLLVDREDAMGGILLQCVHSGFGLHYFGDELTGPEFAGRLERASRAAGIPVKLGTTVLSIDQRVGGYSLLLSSARDGVSRVTCRSVILAMGSRERNRGNVRIAGDRPAGVFTAGLAQRLINMEGYLPGKSAVIIGSGDIGLIMARRLTLSRVRVEAVVELLDSPSGLARNVAQCLDDFSIPLYLSHATLRISGRDRVNEVEVAPMENGAPVLAKAFTIPCDTVLLSVGLVPENELSAKAGIALNPVTNGPLVDSSLMTTKEGIFACGNVLHIHDLVDRVAEEASLAGDACADYLERKKTAREIPLKGGLNVRYTVPSRVNPDRPQRVSLRSLVALDTGVLAITLAGKVVFSKRLSWVRPGEMIALDVPALANAAGISALAEDSRSDGELIVSISGVDTKRAVE